MDTRPIGIFDSGSGGLSVWKAISTLSPREPTVYIGDHANIPYSTKTTAFIRERGMICLSFLRLLKVKMIVVACNTATVSGIGYFRGKFPGIPIVGVVPVVKTAVNLSKARRFGVLSTERTAKSAYQHHLITTFASDCEVFSVGNTELVRMVEDGRKDSEQVRATLTDILQPLMRKKIDVLVLGCTHFPFLRPVIQEIVGPHVLILDSGEAVARHVRHILEKEDILSDAGKPLYRFFTTGDPGKVSRVASALLATPIAVKKAPGF